MNRPVAHQPSSQATRLLILAASFLFLPACAETSGPSAPSAPVVVFPTRAEIAKIPAKAPVPAVFGAADVGVDEWSVQSDPLPVEGTYDDASVWGTLARDLASARAGSVSLSPAMRCAAAEVARFSAKNGALPVEALRRFILARCGGDSPLFAPYVLRFEVPDGVKDEELATKARDELAKAADRLLAHGHHVVGVAAARDGRRVAVALAVGEDEARLDPGPRSADAQRRVTIQGVARAEYAQVVGLVNQGDYGVARCQRDARVSLPHFAFTCELATGDPFAWVEVVGQKQGRVVMRPLADLLVYQDAPRKAEYRPKKYGKEQTAGTPASFSAALVEGINRVRSGAKLAPLTLAAKQSAENERLAGTILDAALAADDGASDKAVIGLLAGWDVEGGMIRSGGFYMGAVGPTRDTGAWLGASLERPIGRNALLDPDARLVAVGPTMLEGTPGVGAVVTTYSLFAASEDHSADETLFLRRVREERAARGLTTPRFVRTSDEMKKAAARVAQNDESPRGALSAMLGSVVWDSGRPAMGYVLETNDVGAVAVPDVLLRPGPLTLSIAITHHRAPGAAWGQYVVFMLLPQAQRVQEASR
jgi:hypothetical protein